MPKAGGGWTSPAGLDATLTQPATGLQVRFERAGETWTFTSGGRLEWREDRNGNRVSYGYDAAGVLVSVTDTRGRVLTVASSGGLITQLQDVTGRTWGYTYTGGRLTTATDPAGTTTNYGYDSGGRLATRSPTRVARSRT